jgi:hypothetical protein
MKMYAYGTCAQRVKQAYSADRAKNTRRACAVHTVHSARCGQDIVDEPGAKS